MGSSSASNAERALERSRIVKEALDTLGRIAAVGELQRPKVDHQAMIRRAALANLCIDYPHYAECKALRDDN